MKNNFRIENKKAFFLIAVFVFLTLIAWANKGTIAYMLPAITLSVLISAFLYSLIDIRNIDCARSMDKYETAEDEKIPVGFKIKNTGIFSKYFFDIEDNFSAGYPEDIIQRRFVPKIKPFQTMDLSYKGTCYKRGLYTIGPVKIRTHDPLGIFKREKVIKLFSKILVYPNTFTIKRLPLAGTGATPKFTVRVSRISKDSEDFYGVRDYERGDSLKHVNWKASAKFDKLMAKQYERAAIQEVTIIIDLSDGNDIGEGRDTTLEYAVKISASVSKFMIKHEGALLQFVAYGKEPKIIPFGRGDEQLSKIMELLAVVKSDGNTPLCDALTKVHPLIPYDSNLMVFMLDKDEEAIVSMAQYRHKRVKLIPVVMLSDTFDKLRNDIDKESPVVLRKRSYITNMLTGLRTHPYYISRNDDLEAKFTEAVF